MMKKILSYFGHKEKWLAVGFIVCSIIAAVLSVIEPKFTSSLVSELTKGNYPGMLKWAIRIAVVAVSSALARFIGTNLIVKVNSVVCKRLELDLCEKALKIKSCYLGEFKSGELTAITKKDPKKVVENFRKILTQFLGILSSIAIAIYVLCFINVYCGLLYIVFFGVVLLTQNKSLKKECETEEKKKSNEDNATSLINQIYRGILDIKVLGLKDGVFSRYGMLLNEEIENENKKSIEQSRNRFSVSILFEIYTFAFFLIGIYLITNNEMSVNEFITIYLYRGYMSSLAFRLVEIRSLFEESKIAMKRANKILEIDDKKLETFGMYDGVSVVNCISIENVTFGYGNGEQNLISHANISFENGFYGVMGESGSAKTTLIKLISRQLEPKSGEIKINGENIEDFSEQGFCDLVSLASQSPYIFSFTIRENMLLVKKNATEAQIWKALDEAKLTGVIKGLEHGLDTQITESLQLSGGQLQRLSLARLFLKDTPIILLDEATSALDNKTQCEVTDVLKEKAKNKIIIAIAHRLEAVKDADKILFMENGKIAEFANYNEIMKNKHFAELIKKEREFVE